MTDVEGGIYEPEETKGYEEEAGRHERSTQDDLLHHLSFGRADACFLSSPTNGGGSPLEFSRGDETGRYSSI